MKIAIKLFKDRRFRIAVIALLVAAAVSCGIVNAEDAETLKESLSAIVEILLTP